ncbi:hypothetical protein BOX15_Mlig024492g2 [Macrostomum lignano]|uniref:Pyr_redox_2 domain-containing protein n=2 Tax=Macrostomum lignano TaxID=282301 RepID=A0A267GKN1_9PLAT|nr:hypothetical protein BOX15_Mlig024492g2 [Macrostomum lignano]
MLRFSRLASSAARHQRAALYSSRQFHSRFIAASTSGSGGGNGGDNAGDSAGRFYRIGAAAAAVAALAAAALSSPNADSRCPTAQVAAATTSATGSTHVTYEQQLKQKRSQRRIVTPIDRFDNGGEIKRTDGLTAADAGDSRSLQKSALTRSAPAALPLAAGGAATGKSTAQRTVAEQQATLPAPAAPADSPGSVVTMSDRTGLPSRVPYLIIGSGFAGMAAARAIRASDPLSKVLMIGDEPYPPYLRPPLSKELWRRKDDRVKAMLSPLGDMRRNSWLFVEPDSFFIEPRRLHLADTGGVSLWKGRRVIALDIADKRVTLDSGDRIEYGKCLLATGGRPRTLPVFDAAAAQSPEVAARTAYFRNIDDFQSLRNKANQAKSVIVIGGGFLGCELAVSLTEVAKKTGLEVHQVFKESGTLAHVLPPHLSEHTSKFIAQSGVAQYPGERVTSVDWDSAAGQVKVGLSSGRSLSADLCLVAVGIEANTQLAESAGLEIDPGDGGFLVNAELEARADLYAAGDACSYYDVLLGRRRVEHVNHAEESGAVAGRNMASEPADPDRKRSTYQHQSSFWCNLANTLAWDAVGLVDSRLETQSFFAMPPPASDDGAAGSDTAEDYQYPGVVFYLKAGRVVGILLWNLTDEIFQDKKAFAPSRLNLARKVLAERQLADPAALQALAREFDVYQTVDDDYQDLKKYMETKERQQQQQAEASATANSSGPAATGVASAPVPA